jgi:hypothetical protein
MNESVYSSHPWPESMCAPNPDARSSSHVPSTAGELSKRNGWAHRDGDRAAHMRWRRKAIKAQSSCQMCGSTDKLDVHHDEHGNPIVLCNLHHVAIDPYARAR